MSTIQRIIEIPLSEVQSVKYDDNIERLGDYDDTCIICGKRVKDINKAKSVQLLTNGNIISTDEDVENSQGFFSVGPDCAKKLTIAFCF